MADKAPGTWSLVVVPAIVTLLVTVVRLCGELQGWDPTWFNTLPPGSVNASGGDAMQGLFGISWLIPIFGFWFGLKLRRNTGQPAHVGKSALRFVIAVLVFMGGFWALTKAGLIVVPDPKAPVVPSGVAYLMALLGVAAILAITAWPRLAGTLVLYGLLARIPVVLITWLAVQQGWDCHYAKLPVGMLLPEGADKFQFLALPQLTFWPVSTLLLGGLFGCLGAALAKRK